MKIAVYPGSFDPVTNGHMDILERTSQMFDKVIVAVVHNVKKKALFTLDERVHLIKEACKHIPNIEVECFSGLLVNFVNEKKATIIIRGLRSMTDFEYESHMSMMNRRLIPNVDTVFVMSDYRYIYVSSSGVKEAALLGGDIQGLVPEIVGRGLEEKRKHMKDFDLL